MQHLNSQNVRPTRPTKALGVSHGPSPSAQQIYTAEISRLHASSC